MPARVTLEVPGHRETRAIEISAGESFKVGRTACSTGDDGLERRVELPFESVSGNHVVLSCAGDRLTLVDQSSRNGTWLRLPPNDPVEVRSEQPVVVRLGADTGSPLAAGPSGATWVSAADYHLGIASAIGSWFEKEGVAARVTTLQRPKFGPEERRGVIPLPNGFDLSIVPLTTMDHRWEQFLAALWRYVTEQNAIFNAEEHTRGEGMVLASAAMRRVHREVIEAARRGVRIHLFGPSGSGKDGLARCYHRNSGRAGTFVGKNCAMFNREFLHAELFGAERGSYTGAFRTMAGAVERAQGGTLFLDEIGEVATDVQAMLLRFLDSGEYERFGGGQTRKADVRVISATNRDLRAAIAGRTFREDLWFRIAGQVIEVPALRSRPEDIVAYLQITNLPSHLSVYETLTGTALERLLEHRWPGNFRELRTFVDQFPSTASARSISADDCSSMLSRITTAPLASPRVLAEENAPVDMASLAIAAEAAFRSDTDHGVDCWDDVKQFLESYLKPLIFASLTGIDRAGKKPHDVAAIAQLIDADRGTVRKQMARFVERFGDDATSSRRNGH